MNTKKRFYLSAPFISVAIIALVSLTGCEYFADPSGSGPVIAAYDQPADGASTISITVSGVFFDTSATDADFTYGGDYVDNGGTVSVDTGSTETQFNFVLSPAIVAGEIITIRAKTTAFNPAAEAASNTVTFTAQ